MAQQTTDDILPPLHEFIYYQCYMMSQVTTKEHIATHNFEDFIYQWSQIIGAKLYFKGYATLTF